MSMDESGNLGKSVPHQREYVVGSCVVNDQEAFGDIAYRESIKKGEEVKFYSDPDLREYVINSAAPYVEDIYYTRYKKDKRLHNIDSEMTTEMRHDIHMGMVIAVAKRIFRDYDGNYIIEVDSNSLVRDYEVIEAIEDSIDDDSRIESCQVKNSVSCPGLQTNDFHIGAIGYSVNGEYETGEKRKESKRFVDMFRKEPKQVRMKFFNRRQAK